MFCACICVCACVCACVCVHQVGSLEAMRSQKVLAQLDLSMDVAHSSAAQQTFQQSRIHCNNIA